ncbi:unnamed protein product [Rotaria sordida]|uniref:C2H2-type domain-containing protein n=1 Tax=Rotaria sordida TaxID=392033 RepID=A0A815F2F1_9BILA|nr:unnamed protein product [Rotaria sordida]
MMLATDAISASSFDRRQQQHHHRFNIFDKNPNNTMDYFLTNTDDISDCDAQSDKSISNNNNAKNHTQKSTLGENTGRSSRRKQLAPRSRLVRQCDECDFSSSIINEFKTHMKFEHGHDQVFLCDICRYYSLSSFDYQLHLNSHQNNQISSSSKLNILSQEQQIESDGEIEDDESINIFSKEQNSTLFENDEQISDDEQNPPTSTNKKLNLSVTSSHSNTTQQTSSSVPDRKRPYNVSVDPARYRRVPDPDDATAVKFACSLCGNLYKWRKSLNKHWKEKHNDESPPPLDAPVTIRPSKSSSNTTIQTKISNRTSEMLPQTSTSTLVPPPPLPSLPPPPPHHPAFPFNPYSWINFASRTDFQQIYSPSTSIDQTSLNLPLDLTIKSTKKLTTTTTPSSPISIEQNPIKKYHRDSNSSNDEQRDSSNYNQNDSDNDIDDDDCHSEHASSSSPPNSYGQKIFICSICEQRFLAIETINEHFLKNHLMELENEISGKSPPRNTNVAQQNEEWNLSDPINPLKCIQCDFIGRWPTELQKHAASHSTSRPFKCLVCSLTYKWRWDLAKHWDRAHACGVKGISLINPYKKRDRDQARSMMELTPTPSTTTKINGDHHSTCSSISSTSTIKKNSLRNSDDDEHSQHSIISDNNDEQQQQQQQIKRIKQDDEKILPLLPTFLPPPPPPPPTTTATPNIFFPPPSFFSHHPMFSSFLNPSLLLQPKFNYPSRSSQISMNTNLDLFKQASAFVQRTKSPNSSRSSSPRTSSPLHQQQRMHAVAAMVAAANGNSNHLRNQHSQQQPQPQQQQQQQQRKFEKEERNFQCRWCDYRGRWRSELIQHMRCHHARDKPYHCSACPYASSWKWDVQKHVKKQHAHDTAKIVELPDKYLFQTTLKAKYEGTDDRTLAPAPLTDEDYSFFGIDVQQKLSSMKYTRDRTLACQQCPFAANSMAELRRHLIVHSAESPYHCFNCDYKSKWKCDVKKHMRLCNHHGPVLVGRKAMAKVMESLGLVIGNNDISKTISTDKQNVAAFAAAAMQMSTFFVQQQKSNEIIDEEEEEEEEIVDEEDDDNDNDDDENNSLIIVDENHHQQQDDNDGKQKRITTNSRQQNNNNNNNLRCRQCDYEADDLSDLLVHRKGHAASMKYTSNFDQNFQQEKILLNNNNNSDIENDDDEQEEEEKTRDIQLDEKMFDYELHWLENNPLIKQLTTIQQKNRIIIYKCSKCNYTINNNRQYFLNHIDHQHPEILQNYT